MATLVSHAQRSLSDVVLPRGIAGTCQDGDGLGPGEHGYSMPRVGAPGPVPETIRACLENFFFVNR